MSVAVGYLAGKGGRSALYLAVEAAKTLKTSLTVVTVVPQPWMTPSTSPYRCRIRPVRRSDWRPTRPTRGTRHASIRSATGWRSASTRSRTGRLPAGCSKPPTSSKPSSGAGFGVGRQARTGGARLDGRPAAALLTGAARHQPARLPRAEVRQTDPAHVRLPRHSRIASTWSNALRALAAQLDVPMRVVTFAVRGRTMYPPEVGLRDRGLDPRGLGAQARDSLAKLKTDGVVGDDVTLQVVTGNGWDQAHRRRRMARRRTAGSRHHSKPADSPGCSSARGRQDIAAQPGTGPGTAGASTSRCRGRRRSG